MQRFWLDELDSPFAAWAWHREHSPVAWHEGARAWFVFRYADVEKLTHDPRLSNQRTAGVVEHAPPGCRDEVAGMAHCMARWVLMLDGEPHRHLRRAIQPTLSEHAVADLAPRIEAIVDELLQRLGDRFDLCQELAYLLPVYLISDLLGLPVEARERVVGWSDDLASYFNVVPPTAELGRRAAAATTEMMAALRGRQGILSGLGLDEADVLANGVVLLVAGHETTRNLIGSAAHFLLTHPEQRQRVEADPKLWRHVIDETLRLEPPNPVMMRITTEEVEVAGQRIPAGQLVWLVFGAANRDPAQFPDPDRFDLSRKPGRHMGFGSGPHFCVGSILARKEAEVALRAVFSRFPGLRLDPDRSPTWVRQAGLRGPSSLPVRTA